MSARYSVALYRELELRPCARGEVTAESYEAAAIELRDQLAPLASAAYVVRLGTAKVAALTFAPWEAPGARQVRPGHDGVPL